MGIAARGHPDGSFRAQRHSRSKALQSATRKRKKKRKEKKKEEEKEGSALPVDQADSATQDWTGIAMIGVRKQTASLAKDITKSLLLFLSTQHTDCTEGCQ